MNIKMMAFFASQKKLLKEGSWAAFGQIFTAIGLLIAIRLLTEFATKEVFGKVSLLIGIMSLGCKLFTAPFISASQRFHPELKMINGVSWLRC